MQYFIIVFRELDTATKLALYHRIIDNDNEMTLWLHQQLDLAGIPEGLFRSAYLREIDDDEEIMIDFKKRISWHLGLEYTEPE